MGVVDEVGGELTVVWLRLSFQAGSWSSTVLTDVLKVVCLLVYYRAVWSASLSGRTSVVAARVFSHEVVAHVGGCIVIEVFEVCFKCVCGEY